MVVEGTRRPCLFPVDGEIYWGTTSGQGCDGLTCGQTADDAGASDGGVHDRNDIGEF